MAAPVAGGGATLPLRVAANRATAGGGAAVVDGSWAGEGPGHAALEIDANIAGAAGIGDGGGLLLERAVLIVASPVHITGNQAGGLGGGAWLESGSIDQRGTELLVAGNVAGVGSGGLHAQGMSLLTTASTQACRGPCVRLDDNEVTGTGINQGAGAALQLLDQTTVAWDRIRIRGNRSVRAPVLFARGSAPFGVSVEWWNAAIVGNTGDLLFGFEGAPIVLGSGGVRLNIALSTIAANQAVSSGNGIPQLLRAFDGAAIDLRGVIVDQPAWVTIGQGVGAQVSLTGACVYSREVASLQARGLPAIAADPRIELGGDGVRLRADSPAIDACRLDSLLVPGAALGQAPLAHDYAGRRRPERVRAGAADSPYDAGADEYVERIFGAGFEAGTD
jgi:hypothetical protein